MARTLPWLVKGNKDKSGVTGSSSLAPKRKRDAMPGDLVDEDLNTTGVSTPEGRKKIRSGRAASSSPPPAPEEAPPVEYMREGLTRDDAWMMVEDEFYSTAQVFTKHIHHAEYVRLKKRAKARGLNTLPEIARPTDGRTAQSMGTKLGLEAMERSKQIQSNLREIDSDEEEDEYMHDPQLAMLMTGPQSNGQDLRGIAQPRSNTRAAAGFSRSPKKPKAPVDKPSYGLEKAAAKHSTILVQAEDADSETDNDDLDAPPRAKKTVQTNTNERPTQFGNTVVASGASTVVTQFSKTSTGRSEKRGKSQDTTFIWARKSKDRRTPIDTQVKAEPASHAKAERNLAFDEFADPPRKIGILAKLKAAREKKERENMKDENELGDVPTFLI